MQTTTMSILAMLRLATTTADTMLVDIIGCSVPTRDAGDSTPHYILVHVMYI